MHLKIGTRSSKLALEQTEIFIDKLKTIVSFTYEIVKIKTTGDKIIDKPLYEIGGKALFLKELEEEIYNDNIDIAVHSLKDVPGVVDNSFYVSGFIGRSHSFDSFLSFKYKNILDLDNAAIVGTSSPRRIAFLKRIRPDLKIVNLRGNINSRIEKLKSGNFDAIILAESGLRRLDLYDKEYCYPIELSHMIPAVGQGVICAEVKSDNAELKNLMDELSDKSISELVKIERDYLKAVDADCDTPVAAYIEKTQNKYILSLMLSDQDYSNTILESHSFDDLSEISGANIGVAIKSKLI